jgi:hypothetical protein
MNVMHIPHLSLAIILPTKNIAETCKQLSIFHRVSYQLKQNDTGNKGAKCVSRKNKYTENRGSQKEED